MEKCKTFELDTVEQDELYWLLERRAPTEIRENVYVVTIESGTFIVEGVNTDLRHYIPTLARRSRCFPRKSENLLGVLDVFVRAYNCFGAAKAQLSTRLFSPSLSCSSFDFF